MIRSRLIFGARPSHESEKELRAIMGVADDVDINPCVFEVDIDGTTRYCCWAGGQLVPPAEPAGELPMPSLTAAGQGAIEALINLPFLDQAQAGTLLLHGIAIGRTPLRDKVIAAFRMSADTFAIIAFIGDLAGELDGKMSDAFNVDGVVNLADCKGMTLPYQQ